MQQHKTRAWRELRTGKLVAGGDLPPVVRAFSLRVDAAYGATDDDPDGDTEDEPGVDLTPEERAWLAARNVASIEAVPLDVWAAMPDGLGAHHRTFALMWASQGYDVYCYSPVGAPGQPRRWNLWLQHERIELGREEAPLH